MSSICFYFQVHQPRRIKRYRHFAIGSDHDYFSESGLTKLNNEAIINKVSQKCYIPATKLIYELLKKHKEFKVTFSFSGIFLEQLEEYRPDVLRLFQKVVRTKRAEVLAETYYHSLSFLYSREEFWRQVEKH